MAFAFEHQGRVATQVRQIAAKQVENALEECRNRDDFDETVHKLRRRCKKVRGLLRIIKPHFKDFDKENAAFRDAANGLSAVRDAAVMGETFEALLDYDRSEGGGKISNALADAVKLHLSERLNSIREQTDNNALLDAFSEKMTQAQKRIERWTLERGGFEGIGDGLALTYSRMRKRMRAAEKDGEAQHFHDWRKDVKYHLHHVSLFEEAAPDILEWSDELLDNLGTYLGDHHNLAVLDQLLIDDPGSIAVEELAAVHEAIKAQEADFEKKALKLGRQLAAEKPSHLEARFEDYWSLLPEKS